MTSMSTAPKFSSTCDLGNHTAQYLAETVRILQQTDATAVDRIVDLLAQCKAAGGRIFFLGVGGGAAHASHAVNDFRKIAGFEAYAPTDNVAELTARINDEGGEGAYAAWLEGSRLGKQDVVFVFSVGGGDVERRVSVNLVRALDYARAVGARIAGALAVHVVTLGRAPRRELSEARRRPLARRVRPALRDQLVLIAHEAHLRVRHQKPASDQLIEHRTTAIRAALVGGERTGLVAAHQVRVADPRHRLRRRFH